jgi:alpha-D-xyloside xylohydrolase
MASMVLLLMISSIMLGCIASPQLQVKVQPWCKDSLRVRIAPSSGMTSPELPESALLDSCTPGDVRTFPPHSQSSVTNGNLQIDQSQDGVLVFRRVDSGQVLFSAAASLAPSTISQGHWSANLSMQPGVKEERIYGLGQGEWTNGSGCASGSERVVPLERNGQTIGLLQRKFHVTIPFAYSSAGYGFLFNMPGYGSVQVGNHGTGGFKWSADAAPLLDFWVTTVPEGIAAINPAPIYEHYADATGHAPMLREDAMIFWQSRLRYVNTTTALNVASKYEELDLPVGVLVVDYYNQVVDGDFQPDPRCYPSLKKLSDEVQQKINASTIFSIWPEAKKNSAEFSLLKSGGCLINTDLGGLAMDATAGSCRKLIWEKIVKPRYFDQGITGFWLDETDGEGTQGGDGNHGYDTSFGPAAVASNLWVNSWLRTFTESVTAAGIEPLVLTRGVWAGGQRHGIVLWSSDIESTFEELTAQVPQGIHASMSGIPWWTSDVGGFGCGKIYPNDSPYMRELIVRWYQFGTFCPVFRTHGCRKGADPEPRPAADVCYHGTPSCAGNEVWSYGNETQVVLERYIRLRAKLKPYIQELAQNVSTHGLPTMRPLWWEFPSDTQAVGINDQYFLGSRIMVAPITRQGATSRDVYFPAGATWQNFFDKSEIIRGGVTRSVQAPLHIIPVYNRVHSPSREVKDIELVV